eukprot:5377185-Alexandrium_andersonii.AAC.1
MGSGLRAYNMFAVSRLAHVWQFAPITPEVERAEAAALSVICRVPHNAMPRQMVCSLRRLGFSTEARSIKHSGAAALARVAATSMTLHETELLIERARDTDDALLLPPLREWHAQSILAA